MGEIISEPSTVAAARSHAFALLARAKKKRAGVRERWSPERLNGCRPADVKNVLVIDSASRSGSSILHYLLSRHPDVVSLNGEGCVFERLHGVGFVSSPNDSDFIAPGSGVCAETLALIADDVLLDSGLLSRGAVDGGFPRDAFLADSVQRLILQYAEIDFDPDELHGAASRALGKRAAGDAFSPAAYWRDVLEELRGKSFPVSPAHYDLRGSDPAADFPDAGNLLPPPFSAYALEEPPFVVPQPRFLPPPAELAGKTLLLKSSSACYRMWLVKGLFPNARFRFVRLARNPAGAISGLIDGWLSNGFYSRSLEHVAPLGIKGYSRDGLPWTGKWWNFDLPPGWFDDRTRSLEEVCSRQWLSANEHIARDAAAGALDEVLPVRYESFLEARSLSEELRRIFRFAGLGDWPLAADGSSSPVMAVTPPAPQKWRKRKDALAPLVSGGKIGAMARELGYDVKDWENWA